MRRQPFPKPLTDQIRCHLHFRVTPRLVGHWRRMAQALSRHPDRFCFYHPDYDQFDLHMEESVMAFLDRCGYDPLLPDANHIKRAAHLLWAFWKKNVHLQRWTRRVVPLSLEQQMEAHGDAALEQALSEWEGSGDDSDQLTDRYWKEWLFRSLLREGWSEPKAKVVVMQVFDDCEYEMLVEYLEVAYHLSVKPTTLRMWVSRDLKRVGRKLWNEAVEPQPSALPADHTRCRRESSTDSSMQAQIDLPLEADSPACHKQRAYGHSDNLRKEPNVAAENPLSPRRRHAA